VGGGPGGVSPGKAASTAKLSRLTERVGLALFLIALATAGSHFLLGNYLERDFHAGHLGLTLLAIALRELGRLWPGFGHTGSMRAWRSAAGTWHGSR